MVAAQDGGTFGRELRRLRAAAGMSQAELANTLHFSKSYLSKVENGVKPPTMDLARRCETVLAADGTLVALCADANAAAGEPDSRGRTRVALPGPRQLPASLRLLVGRDRECKMLTSFADSAAGRRAQHTVLTGPAGIGKTALAVSWSHQNAERFPDGQLYVNLRGFAPAEALVTPAEALGGFLDALGVPPEQTPTSIDAQSALFRSLTASRRMLVLLDNARDAEQVRPLLPAGDGCVALVTSRSDLAGLVAEGADAVVPGLLTAAEAESLLAARLGAARLAEEHEAAADLIAFCGGLPLAVAIVAARAAKQLGPTGTSGLGVTLGKHVEAMRAMRSRLDGLSTGDLTTDVRAVFSWSYRMLTPTAAELFRLLAAHPGPDCSEAAARSLIGRPASVADAALAELSATHLVAEHVPRRYTCHDLLRVYGGEVAAAVDDASVRQAAIRRVLDHYLHTAQAATLQIAPAWPSLPLGPPVSGVVPEPMADAEQAEEWFGREFQVLLGVIGLAVASGNDRHAWQLPWTMRTFLDRRGHWREMEHTHRTALAAAQRLGDATGEAVARLGLGRTCLRLRDYDAALTHIRRALHVYQRQGDRLGQAHAHHDIALVAEQQGDHTEALSHAQQALAHFQAEGAPAAQANALNTVGWFHALTGDYPEALACCTRALGLFRGLNDVAGEAGTWDSVGYARHCLGDYEHAIQAYQESIDGYRRIGDRFYEAGTIVRLGDTHLSAGDAGAARRAWRAALTILEELQHPDAEQVARKLRSVRRA